MNTTTNELADLLREAGSAHHQAFLAVDGADPDWALWYADYLHPKISGAFGFSVSKA
ncbi:MAG: hypothetical protein AAF667_01150 [Pseudomonadota bacterium]